MTFKRFEELLHTKYPEAQSCAHGTFANTEHNGKVEINFIPNGKCYCYYGSYQDVLRKVGVLVEYKKDVEIAEKRLQQLKEEHGKPNKYSFFEDVIVDNSVDIAYYEKYLEDVNNGKYVII